MEEKKKTAREIIEGYDGPPVRIMEVCGTHTHEIFRLGFRKLLPEQVELISGPGCPVCVTQVGFIDEAIYLALERQVTICTFGDLVRVPGTNMSLAGARERGAKIRIVYSPVDAKEYAKEHPKEQVTFLSVGFETTTPSACLSVKKAREEGLPNYSILTANKTMPQAYEALKGSADIFLYPGHVNAITGTELCEHLTEEGVSGVVAGFTATNKLYGLLEMAAISYGYEIVTYVGQNLGAKQFDRIKSGVRVSLLISLATSIVISVAMFLFGKPILSLFLSGEQHQIEAVLEIAFHYLSIMAAMLWVLYFLYVYRSALQGLGDTLLPMLSGFAEFLMRIGAALILPIFIGQNGIFFAEIAAWSGAALLLCISYYTRIRAITKKYNENKR